jgi:hypothetical protein
MQDIAKRLSVLLGATVEYHERSAAQQAARLTADGLPPLVVDVLLGLDESIREGWHAEPTSVVADLTGTAARPVDDWLSEHVAEFRAR